MSAGSTPGYYAFVLNKWLKEKTNNGLVSIEQKDFKTIVDQLWEWEQKDCPNDRLEKEMYRIITNAKPKWEFDHDAKQLRWSYEGNEHPDVPATQHIPVVMALVSQVDAMKKLINSILRQLIDRDRAVNSRFAFVESQLSTPLPAVPSPEEATTPVDVPHAPE